MSSYYITDHRIKDLSLCPTRLRTRSRIGRDPYLNKDYGWSLLTTFLIYSTRKSCHGSDTIPRFWQSVVTIMVTGVEVVVLIPYTYLSPLTDLTTKWTHTDTMSSFEEIIPCSRITLFRWSETEHKVYSIKTKSKIKKMYTGIKKIGRRSVN